MAPHATADSGEGARFMRDERVWAYQIALKSYTLGLLRDMHTQNPDDASWRSVLEGVDGWGDDVVAEELAALARHERHVEKMHEYTVLRYFKHCFRGRKGRVHVRVPPLAEFFHEFLRCVCAAPEVVSRDLVLQYGATDRETFFVESLRRVLHRTCDSETEAWETAAEETTIASAAPPIASAAPDVVKEALSQRSSSIIAPNDSVSCVGGGSERRSTVEEDNAQMRSVMSRRTSSKKEEAVQPLVPVVASAVKEPSVREVIYEAQSKASRSSKFKRAGPSVAALSTTSSSKPVADPPCFFDVGDDGADGVSQVTSIRR